MPLKMWRDAVRESRISLLANAYCLRQPRVLWAPQRGLKTGWGNAIHYAVVAGYGEPQKQPQMTQAPPTLTWDGMLSLEAKTDTKIAHTHRRGVIQ